MYICIYVYIYIYIYIYIFTHAHTHTHTYTYMRTREQCRRLILSSSVHICSRRMYIVTLHTVTVVHMKRRDADMHLLGMRSGVDLLKLLAAGHLAHLFQHLVPSRSLLIHTIIHRVLPVYHAVRDGPAENQSLETRGISSTPASITGPWGFKSSSVLSGHASHGCDSWAFHRLDIVHLFRSKSD